MNAQMKKGVMEMCVLSYLSKKDLYGYDVMKLMRVHFTDVADSTFYAILRRLHGEDQLRSYIGADSEGPLRKYYAITEKGRRNLDLLIKDWTNLFQTVDSILHENKELPFTE